MVNLSIKQYITLAFSAFVVISIILVGMIGVFFTNDLGNTTLDQSSEGLKKQIQSDVLSTAEKDAQVIDKTLADAANFVSTIASQVESFMSSNQSLKPRTSYYDNLFRSTNLNTGNVPSDMHYNASYYGYISFQYSSYFATGMNTSSTPQLTTNESLELNRTANIDFLFQEIYHTHPEYGWLYITFQDTKLMRLFPGTIIDETSQRDYDPTLDEWYTLAENAHGNIIYTAPYFDTQNGLGLLMSITKAIYYPNGQFMGVVGIDITIRNVQNDILNINILNGAGYAALIQKPDGIVIAYPNSSLNKDDQLLTTVDPFISNQTLFTIVNAVSPSIITYQRNNQNYFLAYYPLSRGDLVVLIYVSVTKATMVVSALQSRIVQSNDNLIILIGITVIIFIILSLIIGILIAQRIIAPVERFTKIMANLSDESLRRNVSTDLTTILADIDPSLESPKDEISVLTHTFKSMITSVKEDTQHKLDEKEKFVPDW